MKKRIYLFLMISICLLGCSTSEADDKAAILQLLKNQEKAWTNYDLEGFMETYWKNDSLQFYGANGLTLGWDKSLASYKERYPTKEEAGTLKLTTDAITKISADSYYVMGQYHLTRKIGNANGVFMIVVRKINGTWKIVADMSC